MSPLGPSRHNRIVSFCAALIATGLVTTSGCAGESAATRLAREARGLYDQGKYAEAMPLLVEANEKRPSGILLYQIGYCRFAVEGDDEARKTLWEEAETLLEKEIAAPGGLTVERLYYLTSINNAQDDFEAMRTFARRAVDEIELGPEPEKLGPEDWFRLARLHDFLSEASEAEAAYRRSVSAFGDDTPANPTYLALALARVADLDFTRKRFELAASAYDRALELLPGTDQVLPYRHGLSLLAENRFEDAIDRFGKDRDPATIIESQYAADIARKAAEVGPLEDTDVDGVALQRLTPESLAERIRQAGREYRDSRIKHSYRRGDPVPAEMAIHQKRFVTLLRERLLVEGSIQDFCLSEGIADLVRR